MQGSPWVLGLLLDLLALAIRAVRTTLTDELSFELPVVGPLIRRCLGGRNLTLLDLVTLPAAAAGTILYKLFHRGRGPLSDMPVPKETPATAIRAHASADSAGPATASVVFATGLRPNTWSPEKLQAYGMVFDFILNLIKGDKTARKRLIDRITDDYPFFKWLARILKWFATLADLILGMPLRIFQDGRRVISNMKTPPKIPVPGARSIPGTPTGIKVLNSILTIMKTTSQIIGALRTGMEYLVKQLFPDDHPLKKALAGEGGRKGGFSLPGIGVSLSTIGATIAAVIGIVSFAVGLFDIGTDWPDSILTIVSGLSSALFSLFQMVLDLVAAATSWDAIVASVGEFASAAQDIMQLCVAAAAVLFVPEGVEFAIAMVLLSLALFADAACPWISAVTSSISSAAATYFEEATDFEASA